MDRKKLDIPNKQAATQNLQVRVTPIKLKALDAVAAENGTTRSGVLNALLDDFLKAKLKT